MIFKKNYDYFYLSKEYQDGSKSPSINFLIVIFYNLNFINSEES